MKEEATFYCSPVMKNKPLGVCFALLAILCFSQCSTSSHKVTCTPLTNLTEVIREQGFVFDKPFENGYAVISNGRRCGLINTEGKVIIPCEYEMISHFHEGLAAASTQEGRAYYNTNGELVIPLVPTPLSIPGKITYVTEENEEWGCFSDGLAAIYQNEGMGYINTKGEVVIPCIYDAAGVFSNGVARVRKDGKMGLINKQGEVIFPFVYDGIGQFSDGLARVYNEERTPWGFSEAIEAGFVNSKGELVLSGFNDASDFCNGIALVRKGRGWGVIDTDGNYLQSPQFDRDEANFKDGIFVSEGLIGYNGSEGSGFWGKTGETVVPFRYESVHPFKNGLSLVKYDEKYGYVDKSGNLVVPCKYDEVHFDDFDKDGYQTAYVDGNGILIDTSGNEYIFDESKDRFYGVLGNFFVFTDKNNISRICDKTGKPVLDKNTVFQKYLGEGIFIVNKLDKLMKGEDEMSIVKLSY